MPARQRLRATGPVPAGEEAVVSAWEIEVDGRKHLSGAAIHDKDGALLTTAEALLIEVPVPNAPDPG